VTEALRVIKVGGNEVDDEVWLASLARLVALDNGCVLVHGGGKEISALQRVMGAEPEWRDGLRYTGKESMRAVAMVLSGLVNKRIVAAVLGAGGDAIGISGEDGSLLRARVARGGSLGRVGEIVGVRASLLRAVLGMGMIPVVSPVSRGEDGEPLNVNADDAAADVAGAMNAAELLLVSNVVGVLRDGECLEVLESAEIDALIESGVAAGGMAPKLRAARRALAAGVGVVRIGSLEMLDDPASGTRIVHTRGREAAA
jgi:acetylglutamate kinase